MSGIENKEKKSGLAIMTERVEELFKIEKRDNPETTGKFHEFILDLLYKGYLKDEMMTSEMAQAFAKIGELERQVKGGAVCIICNGTGSITISSAVEAETRRCGECNGTGML